MQHLRYILIVLAGFAGVASAAHYTLPPQDSVVGQIQVVESWPGVDLFDIARFYQLGLNQIATANPGMDPLRHGHYRTVVVPTEFVLPDAPREGIVINMPEMRLFYYPTPDIVYTYPLGGFQRGQTPSGRRGWAPPLGSTTITAKVRWPWWVPPRNIAAQYFLQTGKRLPSFVPPGSDNPMGELALRTGWFGLYIHGTNEPWSVGRRESHGCFRMYPELEARLFPLVPVGTEVRTVNQPVLVGERSGVLYIQVFRPLHTYGVQGALENRTQSAIQGYLQEHPQWQGKIDWERAYAAAKTPLGIPTPISLGSPRLETLLAGIPIRPYDFPPYGANANNAAPPPELSPIMVHWQGRERLWETLKPSH